MVFIRPTIIRSEADMQALTDNRYDFIRSAQIAGSESGTSSLESIVEMMLVEMGQDAVASRETAGD